MRILLAHNSLYYPSHGGGDKSNRLLMEALAARGHSVRVVSRVERFGPADTEKLLRDLAERGLNPPVDGQGVVQFELNGVDVRTVAGQSNLRPYFSAQIAEHDPDIIVTSTDDPGQLLLDLALRAPRARVVYLIRATIAVPFGPDSSAPNPAKTELVRRADRVVGVSEYVAAYARRHGVDAVHVPISLLEPGSTYPDVGSFDNPYVTITNPCAVKGIGIFLALADELPYVQFAAVPTWGTTADDRAALKARRNVTLLPPVDNIDDLLRQTRIMLVPSVWAEARSRIVVEAMSRGVPVISSDAGGIPEAHMGVPYMIPVRVIERYLPSVDPNMVPVPEVPPQDIAPWRDAVQRMTTDRTHWEEIAHQSREAALRYAENLSVQPFEALLEDLLKKPKKAAAAPVLSDEKRRLLALRLKQKTAASRPDSFLPGIEDAPKDVPLLICLPWAGGGTLAYSRWKDHLSGSAYPVPVRLPGRETRAAEAPFETMEALIAALGPAVESNVRNRRFALFGHSMGAGVAYELTRWLRAHGSFLPSALVVSGARAPQFRLTWQPGPDPTDEELVSQLGSLDGLPADVLDSAELMRLALPALRADTRLYRHYRPVSPGPLDVPITALGGADDPNVRPEHLQEWSEQTRAEFSSRMFPGGHFYLLSPPPLFFATLRAALTQE